LIPRRLTARWLRPALLGLVLLSLAVPASAAPVRSDQPNRAGLVIRFDDGTLVSRCVEFQGAETTGSELLTLSGIDVVIDSTHGGGITVCKIEGTGCDYPVHSCFCQCMGNGPCGYWNYYYREPGRAEWVYSTLGALIHPVTPGSVEAWVWGDGHEPPDQALTFEAVCGEEAALALTPQPGGGAAVTPILPPDLKPSPSPEGKGERGGGGNWRSYWPFGLMLLTLVAIAVYLRFGRH
jgi:hypothetical protein